MNDKQNWEQRIEELLAEDKSIFAVNLEKVRSNRISIELLKNIIVNLPERKIKLSHLASLQISSTRDLIIHAFNKKDVPMIIKALLDNELGYKLENIKGELIYFSLVLMTEETRKKLIQRCKEKFEVAKISVRNSRQKILNEIRSSRVLSTDQEKSAKRKIEQIVNFWNVELTNVYNKKVNELATF